MPDTEREFSSEKRKGCVRKRLSCTSIKCIVKSSKNRRGNGCDTKKAWYNENIVASDVWERLLEDEITEGARWFIVHRRRIYVEKSTHEV